MSDRASELVSRLSHNWRSQSGEEDEDFLVKDDAIRNLISKAGFDVKGFRRVSPAEGIMMLNHSNFGNQPSPKGPPAFRGHQNAGRSPAQSSIPAKSPQPSSPAQPQIHASNANLKVIDSILPISANRSHSILSGSYAPPSPASAGTTHMPVPPPSVAGMTTPSLLAYPDGQFDGHPSFKPATVKTESVQSRSPKHLADGWAEGSLCWGCGGTQWGCNCVRSAASHRGPIYETTYGWAGDGAQGSWDGRRSSYDTRGNGDDAEWSKDQRPWSASPRSSLHDSAGVKTRSRVPTPHPTGIFGGSPDCMNKTSAFPSETQPDRSTGGVNIKVLRGALNGTGGMGYLEELLKQLQPQIQQEEAQRKHQEAKAQHQEAQLRYQKAMARYNRQYPNASSPNSPQRGPPLGQPPGVDGELYIKATPLRKEAEFLRQALEAGTLSSEDRTKAIEIIRLIEGGAPEKSSTREPESPFGAKPMIFNISSNNGSSHEHGSSVTALDMKMHDLTKMVTKMKAFDKFQRMQNDRDRLVRIEEKLSKSKDTDGLKESHRVTAFHKRTAREVEKVNRRLNELSSRDVNGANACSDDEISALMRRMGDAEASLIHQTVALGDINAQVQHAHSRLDESDARNQSTIRGADPHVPAPRSQQGSGGRSAASPTPPKFTQDSQNSNEWKIGTEDNSIRFHCPDCGEPVKGLNGGRCADCSSAAWEAFQNPSPSYNIPTRDSGLPPDQLSQGNSVLEPMCWGCHMIETECVCSEARSARNCIASPGTSEDKRSHHGRVGTISSSIISDSTRSQGRKKLNRKSSSPADPPPGSSWDKFHSGRGKTASAMNVGAERRSNQVWAFPDHNRGYEDSWTGAGGRAWCGGFVVAEETPF